MNEPGRDSLDGDRPDADPGLVVKPGQDGADAGVEVVHEDRLSVRLEAIAFGHARIYQAARDLHIHQAPAEGPSRAQLIANELLVGFETTPLITGLLARVKRHRWVSLTGSPGSGKSTLLTALTRPQASPAPIPDGFLHALVYCDATTTEESFALELYEQLRVTVPGYTQALSDYYTSDETGWQEQAALARYIDGPLRRLMPNPNPNRDMGGEPVMVRLGVDGLDQLGPNGAGAIPSALIALAAAEGLPGLRLVVTHRDPNDPALADLTGRSRLDVDVVNVDVVARYLRRRQVPTVLASTLATACAKAGSAWLAARLFADVHADLDPGEKEDVQRLLAAGAFERATALAWLYDKRLDTVPGWTKPRPDPTLRSPRSPLRAVLTALTAAGTGPIAPLPLLAAVSGAFGGPGDVKGVRAVLNDLGRLVVRIHPGSDQELVGLFHPTLTDHLANPDLSAPGRLDVTSGRRILLEEIEKLAPVTGIYTDNPLYRWATTAQAEHYWQLGMPIATYESLKARPLPVLQENLTRWQEWLPRFHDRLGPTHRYVFAIRAIIANEIGEVGDAVGALRLLQELLRDEVQVRGAQDLDSLVTRGNIASWTGEAGDAVGALRLFQELLPELVRMRGAQHPDTLSVRSLIAFWTGGAGDAVGALRLFQELLPDRVRMLGAQHPDTLYTRSNIAGWTGTVGDAVGALRLFQELLSDEVRMLGARHRETLSTRSKIAALIGELGDVPEALRLSQELLPDEEQVLGAQHPGTLATRNNIAVLSESPRHVTKLTGVRPPPVA